jgi:hypothetical protein
VCLCAAGCERVAAISELVLKQKDQSMVSFVAVDYDQRVSD